MELDEPRESRPQEATDARQTGTPDEQMLKFAVQIDPIKRVFDHADTGLLQSELQISKMGSSIDPINYSPVLTFIGNAARIDGPATSTVHHALHSLLASTRMLHDLSQRYPGTAGLGQLGLTDVDNAHLIGVKSNLDMVFSEFEHFLFKATDGAGRAICVAVCILFIITMVLRKTAQQFLIPVLTEGGVDIALQVLFGLISISHRNIGVLDILQQFSGQELNPSLGEPSPDVIEALQDILSTRASLARPMATGSLGPMSPATTSSQPTLSEFPQNANLIPHSLGKLDGNFQVQKNAKKFFVEGRVFMKLHTEDVGDAATTSTSGSGFSTNSYGERVYSQLQRPITTYGGRGVAKKGVDPKLHTIVYTGTNPPQRLPSESGMNKDPIQVIASTPDNKLAPMSRVNLGKTYTIEWISKVKEVGMVASSDLRKLRAYWEQSMDMTSD
ncbi:MAG: hypothetical protein Q9218_002123 [Villophora microphyllina]